MDVDGGDCFSVLGSPCCGCSIVSFRPAEISESADPSINSIIRHWTTMHSTSTGTAYADVFGLITVIHISYAGMNDAPTTNMTRQAKNQSSISLQTYAMTPPSIISFRGCVVSVIWSVVTWVCGEISLLRMVTPGLKTHHHPTLLSSMVSRWRHCFASGVDASPFAWRELSSLVVDELVVLSSAPEDDTTSNAIVDTNEFRIVTRSIFDGA
mmetsp:Transcript_10195/g.29076  ORF Transcript_10195/g.29076 Transcript_10195/m.29076 type:complete len:211 (+) Transcript_10195:562-1194(+)